MHGMCKLNFRQHCMPYFKENKIVNLDDQLFIENCKLMHRVNSGIAPAPVINTFDKRQTLYVTRNAPVNVCRHYSDKLNKSFLCKSVMDWNKLPIDLRSVISTKLFGKKLKHHCLNKY